MSARNFLNFEYGLSRKSSLNSNPSSKLNQSTEVKKKPSLGGCLSKKTEEMKWIFSKFDTNQDGKISLEEYQLAVKALDKGVDRTETKKAFQAMDSDGDGCIDFPEFLAMFKAGGEAKASEIESAFCVFDLDGDGKITAKELLQVLNRLGERCSLGDCRKMVKGVDSNGDGFIDLKEFMNMMSSGIKMI